MTVYYLGRTARITEQVFESRWPIQRSFVVSELRCPHTPHDSTILVIAASTQVRVCSGGALGLSAFVAVTGWPVFDVPAVTVAGSLAAVIAALVVGAAQRSRRQPLEVRALYRGELVCLYITTNRHTFGQVRRALLRALEHQDDGR